MAIADLEARVQVALDRQGTGDMLNFHWRAIDRCAGSTQAGRHPEDTDDHGAFSGNAREFAKHIIARRTERILDEIRAVTCCAIDMDGVPQGRTAA